MRRCLLAILLATAAVPASAGRWAPVVDGSERAVYLDTAALAREGNQVRAWVREVHAREQRSEQVGVAFYSANALMAYDCSARTSAPLFKVFFGVDGMELRRVSLDAAEGPSLAVPGSLQEQLLDRACAATAKPVKDAPKEAREPVREASRDTAKETASNDTAKAGKSPGKPAARENPKETDKVAADGRGKDGEQAAASKQTPTAKAGEDKASKQPESAASSPNGPLAEKAKADKSVPGRTSADMIGPAAPVKPAVPTKPAAGEPKPESPEAAARAGSLFAKTAAGASSPLRAERAVQMTSPIRSVEQASAIANGYAVPVRVSVRRPGKGAQGKPAADHGEPQEVHWSYGGNGGPEQWGRLKPEYELCAKGTRQSPIDIRDGAKLELEPIAFDYKPSPLRIVDNGHTVQVNYTEGSSITVAGERFDLRQFHFHKPAEERVDGRSFALVAHLVHQSAEGRLAVVAVLFDMREQENGFLRTLWPHLPLEPGRETVNGAVTLDVNALLPETRTYYTYMGSLTTPPCSEGVRWIVLKTPVDISPEQVAVFGKLYMANARPVQPANGRLIKESM